MNQSAFTTASPGAGAPIRDTCSDAEWAVRVDLACCYRLVADFGWEDLIYTHLSARVPGPDHHFLINPLGMLFSEIRASDLIKIDLEGNKISESPYPVNRAGFTIHSAIHEARDDAQCVIHLHTVAGAAVSAQEQGLLPITQNALGVLSSLAYHDYEGVALDLDERPRLVADLGTKNQLLLRNHGTLAVGRSVGHAFASIHALERACAMQVAALAGGVPVRSISAEVLENEAKRRAQRSARLRALPADSARPPHPAWAALRRKMDRLDPGYAD